MTCRDDRAISRRQLLIGGAAASLALWGLVPRSAIAGTRDARLLTVVLRGGLDGLALVAPVGDPEYVRLRGKLALAAPGASSGARLALDSFFALNAAMPFLHGLYVNKEALFVHAVATPYRGRSHFDGQDVLESGLAGTGRVDDGWMNRALGGLATGGAANPRGLAMGPMVPLVMRGPAPVLSWTPKANNMRLRDSTVARLTDLYGETDPLLAKAFADGLEIGRVGDAEAAAQAARNGQTPQRPFRDLIEAAEAAAKFLSAPDGPRIGALSYNGWDTHANEGAIQGQLANRLAGLDAAIKAFAEGMGPAWKETVVVLVTEFGRTARINGTDGTDHGTATVAVLVGGAVRGGRVIADWPGLGAAALHEGRDLKPTADLRGVLKGVLQDHVGLSKPALDGLVFPDSARIAPSAGLIV
jgi:uncharacterized protein (DUF1501 family)